MGRRWKRQPRVLLARRLLLRRDGVERHTQRRRGRGAGRAVVAVEAATRSTR